MSTRTFTAGFLFCGLGAGARGFLEARANLGPDAARFVSLGGIDKGPEACADFVRLTGSPALQADVATLTPTQLRAAWGEKTPDCVFLSPPCKGFSGLLSASSAAKPEYQALNQLVIQGVFLLCETWSDGPPATIVLENVPRITSRGKHLLVQVRDLLTRYGYRLHEGGHDCGEIGGGGTVLDPFAGTGTTGEAATSLGCDAILIELVPAYVEIARRRTAQQGLFAREAS